MRCLPEVYNEKGSCARNLSTDEKYDNESGKTNNKWPQVRCVVFDRISCFWNSNKNFRVAGKYKGRSGNRKHTYCFGPYQAKSNGPRRFMGYFIL